MSTTSEVAWASRPWTARSAAGSWARRPCDLKPTDGTPVEIQNMGETPMPPQTPGRDAREDPDHGRDAHATPSHGLHSELWYQNLSCWFEVARASRPWV
jgi:hypothetical protein